MELEIWRIPSQIQTRKDQQRHHPAIKALSTMTTTADNSVRSSNTSNKMDIQPGTPSTKETSAAAKKDASTASKRRDILSKFLSKTFHILSQCPSEIAEWSYDGRSFTIKNADAFAADVLPQYFNHNKFQSFTRQLNFYGFVKKRSDPDLQAHTKAVRFSHPYFRRGEPELLHKITRTTASKPPDEESFTSDPVERLQLQVAELKEHVAVLERSMDQRVEDKLRSLERGYALRLHKLECSYEACLLQMLQQRHFPDLLSLTSPSQAQNTATNLAELTEYLRSKQSIKSSP
jgi:HSF-type DNA-binding